MLRITGFVNIIHLSEFQVLENSVSENVSVFLFRGKQRNAYSVGSHRKS
jgi:hypothetical protein